MRRAAAVGLVALSAACMQAAQEKYAGLVLDPARLGTGYGVSMNKANPGFASICATPIGSCYLDPQRPTDLGYECDCRATGGEPIRGVAR